MRFFVRFQSPAPLEPCASCLQPLSQTELRDLPLLFRCFAKFKSRVVSESALQNCENLLGPLARRTHNENLSEPPLVLPIALGKSDFRRFAALGYFALLLSGPSRRLFGSFLRR